MRSVSSITEDYSGRQKVHYPSSTDIINEMTTKEFDSKMETALLSESVLAREWISPEEDEAWKDL